MSTTSPALVLRVIDFGESDRVVHLLLPDTGRLAAIAKGAKRSVRRFPGTLDLFNHLRVELARRRSGAMARLEHAVLLDSHPAVREQPARFALACYVVELLDRLAPEGGARSDTRQLFAFACETLGAIAACAPDERLRVFLELRALEALGLRPELSRCVRCGRGLGGAGTAGFHVGDGGAVCGGCALHADGVMPVHLGTLRALEQGLRFTPGRLQRLALGRQALDEALALVRRFHRYHLGVELRSERFLDEIVRAPAARSAA